jgi:uncharacterized protein (TIGR02246 family)
MTSGSCLARRSLAPVCFLRVIAESMPERFGHSLPALTLSVLMLGCSAGSAPTDEASIRALINEEEAAWNAGDAAAYSRHFAPDGTFTNIYGMTFDGHDAFEKRHAQSFATFFKGSRRQQTIRHLKFVSHDVAIVNSDATVTGFGRMPPGISIPPDRVLRTRLQQVLVKRGGRWWIEAYHNVAIAESSGV